ncbi:MAG: methyltransferase domain-containing protein [Longimicrobiales bacterium]
MSVAEHLNIDVAEYDARIRTFIPDYDELIATAAAALCLLETSAPEIVDLGTGTGALAAKCLEAHEAACLIGIDSDATMIEMAAARLAAHSRVGFVRANFLETALAPCDAIVTSLALHHIPTAEAKRAFYAACREALRPGGVLVSADCFTTREPRLAASQHDAWLSHLRQTYPLEESERFLATWAGKDVYSALQDELEWLRGAGLMPEVVWRKGRFAVVAAVRAER